MAQSPRPKVNAEGLSLNADNETPGKLIHTMLDLIALAFQTDSTRFITYQLASMHGAISIANKFPTLLGFTNNAHGLAHGAGKGKKGAENKGEMGSVSGRMFVLSNQATERDGRG